MFRLQTDIDGEQLRTERQQQKKVEYHLVGKQKKVEGHILFSFNTVTKEIKPAKIQHCKDIDFLTREPVHKPKVVKEKDCVYMQALNRKNFIKRLIREGYDV